METINRSFGIYQANGKRKDGLKKAFVEVMDIADTDDYVKLKDGSIWPLHYDTDERPIHAVCKFIVSFQVYDNGEFYAVARHYKEKVKA